MSKKLKADQNGQITLYFCIIENQNIKDNSSIFGLLIEWTE